MILNDLSELCLNTNREIEALNYAEKAFRILEDIGEQLGMGFVYLTKGDILLKLNKETDAINNWRNAHQIGLALNHPSLLTSAMSRMKSER